MGTTFAKPAYPGDCILWVPEICQRANVAQQTVYKWFSNGTLPAVHLGGRRGCWESDFLAKAQPSNAA